MCYNRFPLLNWIVSCMAFIKFLDQNVSSLWIFPWQGTPQPTQSLLKPLWTDFCFKLIFSSFFLPFSCKFDFPYSPFLPWQPGFPWPRPGLQLQAPSASFTPVPGSRDSSWPSDSPRRHPACHVHITLKAKLVCSWVTYKASSDGLPKTVLLNSTEFC